jgi:hypothetical protein
VQVTDRIRAEPKPCERGYDNEGGLGAAFSPLETALRIAGWSRYITTGFSFLGLTRAPQRQEIMATEGSSSLSTAKPTIGVVSIGDMGSGIAKLLRAHEYQVFTSSADRRQASLSKLRTAADTYKS